MSGRKGFDIPLTCNNLWTLCGAAALWHAIGMMGGASQVLWRQHASLDSCLLQQQLGTGVQTFRLPRRLFMGPFQPRFPQALWTREGRGLPPVDWLAKGAEPSSSLTGSQTLVLLFLKGSNLGLYCRA